MNRRQFFKRAGVGLVGIAAIPFLPWESLKKGWVAVGRLVSNKTMIRTGLPTATWRKLYQGIQPNKIDKRYARLLNERLYFRD